MNANAPMIVMGTVVAGTNSARQLWRKIRITMSTSAPGLEERHVHFFDRGRDELRRVEGDVVLHALRQGGLHLLHRSRTPLATSSALLPGSW